MMSHDCIEGSLPWPLTTNLAETIISAIPTPRKVTDGKVQ